MPRHWTPWEKNWLLSHGISDSSAHETSDIPVEYIVGRAPFFGREFIVNQDVLIPRIETEQIISLAFTYIKSRSSKNVSIADVATGTGCLGISFYLELKRVCGDFQIYLSDISPKALDIAKKNLKLHQIPVSHCPLVTSDLFSYYPSNVAFDLIVANLPYIPTERIPKLSLSVKNFEPWLALDGGKRGTKIINRFLCHLPSRLNPQGLAILEIDEHHKTSDLKIPKSLKAKIIKDQFGKNRFLVCH